MNQLKHEKVLALVSARNASVRFPGKLLYRIGKHSILSRVYASVTQSKLIEVRSIVLDHDLLKQEAMRINAHYIISTDDQICGTDRCIAALDHFPEFDILINVQADQPFITPIILDKFIALMKAERTENICFVMTVKKCTNQSKHVVKVSIDKNGYAGDFFRQIRDNTPVYTHTGIYRFRLSASNKIKKMPPGQRELALNLEQLRWIENGFKIKMFKVVHDPVHIDVPDDLLHLNLKDVN